MRFLYRLLVFISLFMTTQTLWACLPFSEHDVFIARLQSSTPVQVQDEPLPYNLQFSYHGFVFRTLITRFLSTKTENWQSDFELQWIGIAPNDLIIGLAYNPDGDQPADFTVVTLAALSCDNDVLTVNKPLVPYLG